MNSPVTKEAVDTSARMVKRMGAALLAAPLAVNARAYDMLMALLAERDAAQAAAREAALKEAAAACRQQMQDFLSPQYATPQPVGSLAERFACGECERAILALATPPGEKA